MLVFMMINLFFAQGKKKNESTVRNCTTDAWKGFLRQIVFSYYKVFTGVSRGHSYFSENNSCS